MPWREYLRSKKRRFVENARENNRKKDYRRQPAHANRFPIPLGGLHHRGMRELLSQPKIVKNAAHVVRTCNPYFIPVIDENLVSCFPAGRGYFSSYLERIRLVRCYSAIQKSCALVRCNDIRDDLRRRAAKIAHFRETNCSNLVKWWILYILTSLDSNCRKSSLLVNSEWFRFKILNEK